ncbi:PQQ-binding-like beta-propeller repeat protein [[Mycobacterium] wendilense]|uniref:PQQ-binding-like beta-propeller repeat protein n=1 Tax=[Mycobacterium] wendilense TaxID=3064284 RepID=A0ABM9MFU2_9MYCO|nr:PQQ-binding-like beta-propeller repeat protein [Mycolicibacterium sp. MU0050]CAJ1584169.1 PQQ-binding-like beta-propeller repeat protein [Mycolicibacterium sp. MU0050]
MLRRLAALASASLVAVVVVAGCADTDPWVHAAPADGWPAPYADAANSSYTDTAGARDLEPAWTRSVKGELGAGVALGAFGYLAANAQTEAGCSLMVWENDNNARQRWCTRLAQGGGFGGPLFDGFDNLYVGQPGAMLSFPPTQWIRWRQQVIGMPLTPRLLGNGELLVVTHLGQVLVFDAHRGTVVGNPIDLVDGVDPTDPQRGLDDCAPARSRCPVAAPPAFSPASGIIVLSLWQPGASAATLVGLRYRQGQNPLLTREWTSDAVAAGVLAAPTLSADGATVYVNGRDRKLWALNADDGEVKWSVPLNHLAQTPPTVSPDGTLLAGGGPDAVLTGIEDLGDKAEIRWRRGDVENLTSAGQAGAEVAYTVVSDEGADGLALLVFDPRDGETINSYPLRGATGFPVGVAVGADGRVVAATSDGQVYGFDAR